MIAWLHAEDPETWSFARRVQKMCWFGNRKRRQQEKDLLDLLVFDSMRKEFVNPRFTSPPFDVKPRPTDGEHNTSSHEIPPEDFDYGRYLTHQLAEFLVEIIEIPASTWVAIWLCCLLFHFIMVVTSDDPKVFPARSCLLVLASVAVESKSSLLLMRENMPR